MSSVRCHPTSPLPLLSIDTSGAVASWPAAETMTGAPKRKRASYLKQGLRIARKNRRVKEVIQYLLVQPSNGSPFTTGIVSPNGTALPSFAVLRAAA